MNASPAGTSERRPILAGGRTFIDFATSPELYQHWKLAIDGDVAELIMDVDENAGLFEGYQLKLNSYDLGVDIELADAIDRLRFEYPEVKVVVLKSGKDRVFSAGANIRMLAASTHAYKVNFCKFTNETRNGMEDASAHAGLKFLCAIQGTAAGGGYELALACDEIILADDGNATVSLPEVPLLAVLPGTGGLTRITDKRKVRRDLADAFCTMEEGIKGKRAVEWRLVDAVVPRSQWDARIAERAKALAANSDRPQRAEGIRLTPLQRTIEKDRIAYSTVNVEIDRHRRIATVTIAGPPTTPPPSAEAAHALGAAFWPLTLTRELDDALLHLRANEPEIGTIVFRSRGDARRVLAYDVLLREAAPSGHWFIRAVRHALKRTFKRVDLTSRTLVALIEPGSCFAGTLAEIVLAADRSIMLEGTRAGDNSPAATLTLSGLNGGSYPMSNGLSRIATRFLGDAAALQNSDTLTGQPLDAQAAARAGLVTFVFDEIDWDDEIRIFLEERASFSADALTGLEANLRFAGPETMETKIFGRLTAWQNWIFQRPNAVGEDGALKRYGSGVKAEFDRKRV